METFLRVGAIALVFLVLLPAVIYSVFVGFAPKKTNREKVVLFAISIVGIGLFTYFGGINVVQYAIIVAALSVELALAIKSKSLPRPWLGTLSVVAVAAFIGAHYAL